MRLHQEWCDDDDGTPKWISSEDLEKRAALSFSAARIFSTEAESELQQLLQHIGTNKNVIGSIVIGHDGLLIASSLSSKFDSGSIGEFALGIYENTTLAVTELSHKHVHQFVGRTSDGYIVIADLGGGLLVTISNGCDTEALIPLMRSITEIVGQ